MHWGVKGEPNPNGSSGMSANLQSPLRTFAVFWRNTEKSEAAMSLLWSVDELAILDRKMKWDVLKLNFRVPFKRSLMGFLFLNFFWMVCVWSPLLCSCGGGGGGGGCSYRETRPHLYALQSASLTGEHSNLSIIYLFWGPAWIQRSRAFRWQLYRNLVNESNSFWLDPFFQCSARGSRVSYRKALVGLGCLLLMAILQSFICGL